MFSSNTRLWIIYWTLCLFITAPFQADLIFPNNAESVMKEYFQIEIFGANSTESSSSSTLSLLWAVFVDITDINGILGPFMVPLFADRIGRIRSLAFCLILAMPGYIFQAMTLIRGVWPLLIIERFISALAFIFSIVIIPVFLSEIAPPEMRGRLGTSIPVGYAIGALLGVVFGLEEVLGARNTWSYFYVLLMFQSLPGLLMCFLIPDTPVFLAQKSKNKDEFTKSLHFYRGPEATIADIDIVNNDVFGSKQKNFKELLEFFKIRALRSPIAVTIAIIVAGTGIEITTFYSEIMLRTAGYEKSVASYINVGLNVLSLVCLLICSKTIDMFPRRRVWTVGLLVSSVFWTLMGFLQWLVDSVDDDDNVKQWLSVAYCVSLVGAQAAMNLTIRPLIWVMIPEMFPFKYRITSKAFALFAMCLYFAIIVILFYLVLETSTPAWAYTLIAGPMWICFGYLYLRLRETAGRTPYEIYPEMLELENEIDDKSPLVR